MLCHVGARVLYRLQPELRDKAVGYITDLSDQLKGRTLEVQPCTARRGMEGESLFGVRWPPKGHAPPALKVVRGCIWWHLQVVCNGLLRY